MAERVVACSDLRASPQSMKIAKLRRASTQVAVVVFVRWEAPWGVVVPVRCAARCKAFGEMSDDYGSGEKWARSKCPTSFGGVLEDTRVDFRVMGAQKS